MLKSKEIFKEKLIFLYRLLMGVEGDLMTLGFVHDTGANILSRICMNGIAIFHATRCEKRISNDDQQLHKIWSLIAGKFDNINQEINIVVERGLPLTLHSVKIELIIITGIDELVDELYEIYETTEET